MVGVREKDMQRRNDIGLRYFSKLIVLSTLFLVFVGSLVTSTGSGLAVPDWPNTYGQFIFSFPLSKMVGGIFYEHGHRLIASGVGFFTLVLAVWLALSDRPAWVKRVGFSALVAVVVQGILGGITVRFFLPLGVSLSHAVLAQTFLTLTIVIAYALSRERTGRALVGCDVGIQRGEGAFERACLQVSAIIYIQLIIGALMRHTGSGLAIPDFPTMGGNWLPIFDAETIARINQWRLTGDLPPVDMSHIIIHLGHRLTAALVIVGAVGVTFRARGAGLRPAIVWHVVLLDALVLVQVALGVSTVLSARHFMVASLHVVTGAALLGVSVLLCLRTLPLRWRPGRLVTYLNS